MTDYPLTYHPFPKDQKFFAIDIETDAGASRFAYPNGTESLHPAGLDPRVARILTISVVGSDGSVFVVDGGDEGALLSAFTGYTSGISGRQASFPLGSSFVGWNTTFFDMPFIRVRAYHSRTAMTPDVVLYPNEHLSYEPKYGYPEWISEVGRQKWNSAELNGRPVIDIVPFFSKKAEELGVKFSLKPLAKALGLNPIEVDTPNVHELTAAERMEYCVSDAQTVIDLIKYAQENDLPQ